MSYLLDAALEYAALGYAVFPCANGAKPIPLTPSGLKDASTDPEQIAVWWSQHHAACIGLRTAGLLVLDVDGADNSWLTPQRANELSQVPTARTPRGGWHFVFRRPADVVWRCSVGRVADKVDIRTDGGYIVVAPSCRSDGHYQWLDNLELNVAPDQLPEPPTWLAEILNRLEIQAPDPVNLTSSGGPKQFEDLIPNGQRNASLARMAGAMRRMGMRVDEMSASLQIVNANRCVPPLDSTEVNQIAKSIARYEPDTVNVALIEGHWDQMFSREPIGGESSVIWFSSIDPIDVQWLWPRRIPTGRISLLVGLPGKGKSLVTLDAAARVSKGKAWPDGTPCPQGSTILITAEDNPNDTIRPRLDAAGADVERVGLLSMIKRRDAQGRPIETPFSLDDVAALDFELSRLPDCKLVVIDPIGSFLGSRTDAHRDNEVRAVLAPVAALAEKYGPAVVVVAHRRKSMGTLADDMALGSRAFTGLARAVWHVTPDPDNKQRRLFLPGKNNLAPEGQGLAFSIEGEYPTLNWEEQPVEMNADECLAAESKPNKPGPKAHAKQNAIKWLREAISDSPRPVKELFEEACEEASITPATLRRAKEELQIEAYREQVPGPWFWRLPQDEQKEEDVSQDPQLRNLERLGELFDSSADVGRV